MQGPIQVISIHALREEGDHGLGQRQSTCQQFLSTPSARRATVCASGKMEHGGISIHALREEGDEWRLLQRRARHNFYPRPPRGGRPPSWTQRPSARRFLSTPSARRATGSPTRPTTTSSNFYPRPPRGGRHNHRAAKAIIYCISIHALREEGDVAVTTRMFLSRDFYPRPPRGGRPRHQRPA